MQRNFFYYVQVQSINRLRKFIHQTDFKNFTYLDSNQPSSTSTVQSSSSLTVLFMARFKVERLLIIFPQNKNGLLLQRPQLFQTLQHHICVFIAPSFFLRQSKISPRALIKSIQSSYSIEIIIFIFNLIKFYIDTAQRRINVVATLFCHMPKRRRRSDISHYARQKAT